ncbi:kelch-like protein 24 [Anneissia japonica]|uniref:kelch-like protein 24 n=1 Tax=Anneissia japonica TaxID=1529436 RepID=UPI001425B2BA|nr:kelch-like protein 24 [Anneissia japonica]
MSHTYHPQHARSLLLRLRTFWESHDFTDVTLDICGRIVNGHKDIISAGSPLIRQHLQTAEVERNSSLHLGETEELDRNSWQTGKFKVQFGDLIYIDLVNYIYTLDLTIIEQNYMSLCKLCYSSVPALVGKGVEDSCNEYSLRKQTDLDGLANFTDVASDSSKEPYLIEVKHYDNTFPLSLLKELNDQRANELFTDVIIQVAGENFRCHRVILSACSTFFRAMFSSSMRESGDKIIRLHQIDLEHFRNIIEFTYTGKLHIGLHNAQELITLASFLHYIPVIDVCSEFFKKHIDRENCISFMNFAQFIGCYQIYNDTLRYVHKHFLDVFESQDFLEVNASSLIRIIEDDHLNIKDEEVVFEAATKWFEANESERNRFGEILSKVRLPLLDRRYFSTSVEQNPLFVDHEECVRVIKDAKMLRDAPEKVNIDDRLRLRFSMTTEVMIIIGGFDRDQQWTHDVWCCNLIDNTWDSLSPFPGRNQRFACVAMDNDVYVIGGQVDYHANLSETLADVWKYESCTDTWKQIASLNKPRHNHGAAVLNGKIYVVGGRSGWTRKSNDVERFDPALNIWTYVSRIKGSFLERPVVTTVQGKLFVNGYFFRDPDIIHCYDSEDDTWSALFNFERVHGEGIETAVVINDLIFYLVSRGDENELIIFNPFTSERIRGSPVPDGRYLYSYGTTVVRGKLIVSGGSKLESAVNVSDIKCYDPHLNIWSMAGYMPQPLTEHGCVCIEKYIPTK